MDSIPYADAVSSVMPLGATWGSDPGGSSWVPSSSKSFCEDSLGKGILEDLLVCHSFARVKFPFVASSESSYTRFSNFLELFPSSCSPHCRICRQISHGTGGIHIQFWCLMLGPLILREMGIVQGILRFLSLISIWVAFTALPSVGHLGRIRDSPGCVSLSGKFGTSHQKNSAPVYLCPHSFPSCLNFGTMT